MKQRITISDIKSLDDDQRRMLTELWTPALYDLAVARVLKNVATDEYAEYEFVVGGISIHRTDIYLTDLVAANVQANLIKPDEAEDIGERTIETETPSLDVRVDTVTMQSYPVFGSRGDFDMATEDMNSAINDTTNENEENQDGEIDGEYDEENSGDEFEEGELEDNYQLPTVHIKDDCTPLLTIGQMIEILEKNNYGKYDFFLSASTYDIGCELGKSDSSWGNYTDWRPAELCDVLWMSVKELL